VLGGGDGPVFLVGGAAVFTLFQEDVVPPGEQLGRTVVAEAIDHHEVVRPTGNGGQRPLDDVDLIVGGVDDGE
jgi:hypothetical protein